MGHAFGWIFLLLIGAINLFRGSVHLFKSDGGASSIAGIDLTLNGEVILMLFAAMGLGQLLMASIDFAAGLLPGARALPRGLSPAATDTLNQPE